MDWGEFTKLRTYVEERKAEVHLISEKRREELKTLAAMIASKRPGSVKLIFICTHNSRRSHMAHLWASLALELYGVEGVSCFSGGTELTSFYPLAVKAISNAGFDVNIKIPGANPIYLIKFPGAKNGIRVFSKRYTDPPNPGRDFLAIMTCSDADEACPVVAGASGRIAITYEDPKAFDGSSRAAEAYAERCKQIAREMLFLFSATS